MKEKYVGRLMVLPCVITLLSIAIFPLLYSLYISFTNYELGRPIPLRFVGLQNYYDVLFKDARFWNALKNTFIFISSTISVQFVVGLILALTLNRMARGRAGVLAALLLPTMVIPVAAGYAWWMLYDVTYGPINYILYVFGLASQEAPPRWLASPELSLPSIILADIWQYTPFMMLILLAGLQAIPPEAYEASQIDGAGRWETFKHITLPLLKPAIAVALLIRVIDAFKIFDLVYILTQGGPGISSEVASYYAYLHGFKFFRMGYASALSYIILIIVAVFTTILLKVLRRGAAT